MIVDFADGALADVDRLRSFLGAANLEASRSAVETILHAAFSLADLPDRGARLQGASARRLTVPFGHAAYLLDYIVDDRRETVTILRVRHSRERR